MQTPCTLHQLLYCQLSHRVLVSWCLPLPSLDIFMDASALSWGFVISAFQAGRGARVPSPSGAQYSLGVCSMWLALLGGSNSVRLRNLAPFRLLPCSSLSQLGKLPLVPAFGAGFFRLLFWLLGFILHAIHVQGVPNILADGLSQFLFVSRVDC